MPAHYRDRSVAADRGREASATGNDLHNSIDSRLECRAAGTNVTHLRKRPISRVVALNSINDRAVSLSEGHGYSLLFILNASVPALVPTHCGPGKRYCGS
jgi:hypothetical protein